MPESPNKSLFSTENDVLRNVLRNERKRLGLTQEQVAKPCGWEQSVIAKIEQGERRIDVVEFTRLAGALGLQPEKLYAAFLQALKDGE